MLEPARPQRSSGTGDGAGGGIGAATATGRAAPDGLPRSAGSASDLLDDAQGRPHSGVWAADRWPLRSASRGFVRRTLSSESAVATESGPSEYIVVMLSSEQSVLSVALWLAALSPDGSAGISPDCEPMSQPLSPHRTVVCSWRSSVSSFRSDEAEAEAGTGAGEEGE